MSLRQQSAALILGVRQKTTRHNEMMWFMKTASRGSIRAPIRGMMDQTTHLEQVSAAQTLQRSNGTKEETMSEVFPPAPEFVAGARYNDAQYREAYEASIKDPEAFWGEQGKRLDWIKPYTKVKSTSFHEADFGIKWFEDGVLNVSANCLDRHLGERGDKIAIIWEGDDPANSRSFTYSEVHAETCRMANVLKKLGVVSGDRVTIYLPMIPAAAFSMLACARIGA